MDLDNNKSMAEIFTGGEFLITPSADEVKMGVVIGGHRFVPFCGDIFISDAEVSSAEGKLEWTQEKFPVSELFNRYAFMGVEEIFPALMAENQENCRLLMDKKTSANAKVAVSVLECRRLFSKHAFEEDDALLVKVVDFEKGIFSCSLLPASKRRAKAQKQWCARFTEVLKEIISRYEDSLTIPEQIQKVFAADPSLLREPGASLDEFYMQDNDFTIAMEQGQSFLALRPDLPEEARGVEDHTHHHHGENCGCGDEEEEETIHVPPGFGISRGETASLGAIIKDLKLPLTVSLLDGFMLDQLYAREYEFEAFYSRVFEQSPDFADDAQEAVFLNELEERFEHFLQRYDRTGDELKGPLRNRIMVLAEDRIDVLNTLTANGRTLEDIPEKTRTLLADSEACFDRILDMLNSPAFTPDGAEADALAESIENAAEVEAAALDEL